MISRLAYWCDVCPLPRGGFAWVYVIGTGHPNTWNQVVCEVNGIVQWQTQCSSTPRYLRCAADYDGNITAVGQGQNGEGLLVIRKSGCYNWTSYCFGPPAVRWNGAAFDIFVQTDNSHYVKVTETPHGLNYAGPFSIPTWPGGNGTTPNGWTQVTSPDGEREELRWSDEYYSRTINGDTFLLTTEYNGIIVGQLGGIAGGAYTDGSSNAFNALDAPAMNPRLAYDKINNKWACCSWTINNLAYYNEFPPFQSLPQPVLTPINRPIYFGFYTFGNPSSDRPSNCNLEVSSRMYLKDNKGNIVLRYIAASDDSNLDELNKLTLQAQKEEPNIPVGGYWTYNAQKIGVPICPIKIVEAYQKTWESQIDFENRIRSNSVKAGKSILAGQVYTSNDSNTKDLKSLPPIYSKILSEMNGGIILFSDGSRPTGWQDHPEIHQMYHDMFNTIP